MMPDSANPVQQSVTIIEIRSYRAADRVLKRQAYNRIELESAKDAAIGYAKVSSAID